MIKLLRHRFEIFASFSLACSAAIALFAKSARSASDGIPWSIGEWSLFFILDAWLLVYALAFLRRRDEASALSRRVVMLAAVLVSLPLLLIPPLSSTDLYANAYYGRLVSEYHLNPYLVPATAKVTDVYFEKTQAGAPFQTTYGPVWIALDASLLSATGTHVGTTLFVFRIINLCALCAIIGILFSLLRGHPSALWAASLLALNPLVLFEGINNGHNDIVMMLFVVGAVAAYQRHRDSFVLPLLFLGGLIKFVPWLLLPFAAIALWRRPEPIAQRLRAIGLGSLIGGAFVVASFLPYWHGTATLRGLKLLGQFFALPFFHPVAMIHSLLLRFGFAESAAVHQAQVIGVAASVVLVIWVGVWLFRRRVSFAVAAVLVMAVFSLFALSYFQPWYFLWVLPLLPLLSVRFRNRAMLAATIIPIAAYAAFFL